MRREHRRPEGDFPDRSWEEHQRRRALQGLRFTPAERLRWLESTMETMRRWVGRARRRGGVHPGPNG